MKNQLKKLSYLLFAGTICLASCGNGDGNADGDDTTLGDRIEAGVDSMQANMQGNPEQDFVKDAVEMNTKELAWLNAGIAMGTDKELKDHAKMMLADHEAMGQEVSAYASAKGLEMPTVDTAGEVNINEKKGRDWDRKWAEKMVDDHQKVINRFERAQENVNDAELKTMVTNTLPKLRHHLEMSEKLRDKLSK
jgi:putative membrane protein